MNISVSNHKLSAVFTALSQAGVRLRELGEFEDAIKCFMALAVDDETYENGDYASEIAKCYREMGDHEKFIIYMKIAHKYNPDIYPNPE